MTTAGPYWRVVIEDARPSSSLPSEFRSDHWKWLDLPKNLQIHEVEFGWGVDRFGSLRMAIRYAQIRESAIYSGGKLVNSALWLYGDYRDVIIVVRVSGPNKEQQSYAIYSDRKWPSQVPKVPETAWISHGVR